MPKKFIQIVPVYPLALTFKEDYFTWPAVMMKELGFECEFVTLADKKSGSEGGGAGSGKSQQARKDFELINGFPVRRFSNTLNLLWYVLRQDCVVHSHLRPYLPSLLAGLLPKKKIITPFTYELGSNFFVKQLSLLLMKRFDKVIAISPYEADVYLKHKFSKEQVAFIPLAIDYKLFSTAKKEKAVAKKFGIDEDADLTIITVANIRYFKRIDILLQAFAEVKRTVRNSQFVIVGGDLLAREGKPTIAEMVKGMNLSGVLRTGYQPSEVICKILKFADVFANTSSVESQCIAAYEAAAAGLPLCLSDIGSFTYVFKGHALFHAFYDAKQLAANILRYHKDKKLAKQHTTFLKEFVKKWDYRFVKEKILSAYKDAFGT